MKNKIALAVAVLLIVGAIWYLQSRKAGQQADGGTNPGGVPIAISDQPDQPGEAMNNAGTTPSSSSATAAKPAAKPPATLMSIAAADKKAGYKPAVELAAPSGFINTEKFALADLVGKKVILLDFWTYSCINCIRTLPHLNSWYQKYKDQGLEIVGVHTPEFEFEKSYDNVKAAAAKYGVRYPIVMDNDYGTWNAYANQYWPHHFLIDIAGYIVDHHIGEGGYEETEAKIQKLLAQRAEALGVKLGPAGSGSSAPEADLSGVGSPETYFGYLRNQFLANGKKGVAGEQDLAQPAAVVLNNLYLVGKWNFSADHAANVSAGAKVIYKYRSGNVYLVASDPSGGAIQVLQDGQPVTAAAGKDVSNGKAQIKESRLYHLISNPEGSSEHTLELIFQDAGIQAYTFTFG